MSLYNKYTTVAIFYKVKRLNHKIQDAKGKYLQHIFDKMSKLGFCKWCTVHPWIR